MLSTHQISWQLLLASYILSSGLITSVTAAKFAHFPNSTSVFSPTSITPSLGAGTLSSASTGTSWLAGSSALGSHHTSIPEPSTSRRKNSTSDYAPTSAHPAAPSSVNTKPPAVLPFIFELNVTDNLWQFSSSQATRTTGSFTYLWPNGTAASLTTATGANTGLITGFGTLNTSINSTKPAFTSTNSSLEPDSRATGGTSSQSLMAAAITVTIASVLTVTADGNSQSTSSAVQSAASTSTVDPATIVVPVTTQITVTSSILAPTTSTLSQSVPSSTPALPSSTQTQPTGSDSIYASTTLTTIISQSGSSSSSSTTISATSKNTTSVHGANNTDAATADQLPDPSDGGEPPTHASVIGITIGVLAAVFLVVLAGMYFKRRRAQGKPVLSRRDSARDSQRAYPESAWLYDPKMTPCAGTPHNGSTNSLPMHVDEPMPEHSNHASPHVLSQAPPPRTSGTYSIFPSVTEPRPGTVELSSAPPSPPLTATQLVSPLFPPEGAGAIGRTDTSASSRRGSYSPVSWDMRTPSPGPSRSLRSAGGGSSMDLLQRPMSAIREEINNKGPDDGSKIQGFAYMQVPERSSHRRST